MSAFDVIVRNDSVHLVSCGACVDAEGRINFVTGKVWALPHLNAVVAVRGPTMAGPFIAPTIGSNAASYEELKASAAGVARECVGALSSMWAGAPLADSIDFVFAGWSRNGPDAFVVCSHDRWGAPWTNIQLGGLTNIPGDQAIVDALDLSDIDPERDGVKMLEMKRKSGKYFVGCWGQLHSIYRDRTESKIICVWPDDVIGTKLGNIPEAA
jgi:hypothetical protein